MSTDTATPSGGARPENTFTPTVFPVVRTARLGEVEERARTRGHAAGYAEGMRRAAAEAKALRERQQAEHDALLRDLTARTDRLVAALAAAADALDARTAPVIESAQDTLAAGALDLAETIIGHELRDGTSAATAALTRALTGTDVAQVVSVHLHPQDLELLSEDQRTRAGVRLVADQALGRGDAVTQFDDGHLDARITAALARARAALTGEDL
jgi:flagellar assembly protein FliH